MNLVGKILTLLILVMSLCFMMIAVTVSATHRNWRDIAMQHKTKIEELQGVVEQLQAEVGRAEDRLAVEQTARAFALAALQTRKETTEAQLRQREVDFSKAFAENEMMTEEVAQKTKLLTDMTTEVGGLRTDIKTVQQDRDTKFNEIVKRTDELADLQGSLVNLQELEGQLRTQVSMMKLVMDAYELTPFTPIVDKPPRVDGLVTKVGDKDLLEISIGSDDGLRPGHTLEVFRDNSYLGRVVVLQLQPDQAVCKILVDYRKGIIKRGDRVATKLS